METFLPDGRGRRGSYELQRSDLENQNGGGRLQPLVAKDDEAFVVDPYLLDSRRRGDPTALRLVRKGVPNPQARVTPCSRTLRKKKPWEGGHDRILRNCGYRNPTKGVGQKGEREDDTCWKNSTSKPGRSSEKHSGESLWGEVKERDKTVLCFGSTPVKS